MRLFIILGLVFVLTLAGCTTSADQNQYDYVPYAGQGCAFSASEVVEDADQNINTSEKSEVVSKTFVLAA